MVLPPTVCGFLLLMLFGRSTGVGRWLIAHGVSLVFSWQAAVISAVVVSFPLVYRTALGAFESLDGRMIDAARTLGWSEARIFRSLMMPLAWPSIAAGTVLAFARAMGEFGCTLFFAGNYAGITQTIPIAIYFEWMGGNTSVALFWVLVVIAFSFLVVWGINAYTARRQGYRAGVGGCAGEWMGGNTSVALFWVLVVIAFSFLVVWGINAYTARRQGYRAGVGGCAGARAVAFGHVRAAGGFGMRAFSRRGPFPGAGVPDDDLDSTGGDAIGIDSRALRELFEDDAA